MKVNPLTKALYYKFFTYVPRWDFEDVTYESNVLQAIESVPAFMRHVTRELDRFKVSHMLIMEIPFENIAALHVQHILFNSKLEKRPRGLLVLDLKKKPVFKSRRISCDARNMSQEKIRTDFTKDKQASQYSRQTFVKLKDLLLSWLRVKKV